MSESATSRKRSKIGVEFVLFTNRKSHGLSILTKIGDLELPSMAVLVIVTAG